jgi:hypothetical protein
MIPIELPSLGVPGLKILGTQLHSGHDFLVRSNSKETTVDFLIFFDSRGISRQFENSIADKLIKFLEGAGHTYLLICRPLESTTWATLINFMIINKINPTRIITNMGFVDFTPKKLSIAKDVIAQAEYAVGKDPVNSFVTSHFESSLNTSVELFTYKYNKKYQELVQRIILKVSTIIINTPYVDQAISFTRRRPIAFYNGLQESARFNRSLKAGTLIELPSFDDRYTYDAVHYTQLGNDLIFDKLVAYL